QKPRCRWATFFTGVFVTLVIVGTGYFILSFARSLASFGQPVVVSDEAVRSRLVERGVELPESAHHLYHASAGFVDHTEYIAFTTLKWNKYSSSWTRT
ncbi:MAG: hypothetical protein PF795_05950, partial [Kiritimatiellae bacterium]|nr:hypothetical protein [Kiritimatiellia bacterium]